MPERKEISRDEYVLAVLQDDLKNRHRDILKAEERLILKPNLQSQEENEKRLELLGKVNGAFATNGNILKCFKKFYRIIITKDEFLKLRWCPKGSNKINDTIDNITGGSRRFLDIYEFLRSTKKSEDIDKKIKEKIKEMSKYGELLNKESDIIKRVYAIKFTSECDVLDGNHRSGGMLYNMSKEEDYVPFELFIAEDFQHEIK